MAASMTFLLQTLFVTMSVGCFLNGMPEYIDSPWPRFYSGIAIAIKLQEKLKRIIELIILKLCLFFFLQFWRNLYVWSKFMFLFTFGLTINWPSASNLACRCIWLILFFFSWERLHLQLINHKSAPISTLEFRCSSARSHYAQTKIF